MSRHDPDTHNPLTWRGQITAEQYKTLMGPLKGSRVAKRTLQGKQLSYLESWDVRAHLIRLFGFGNFDIETEDQKHIVDRRYESKDNKPMVEVSWFAKVRLTVRSATGRTIATYSESAVGSASGPDYLLGDLHDNAIKTAASDALKRCAINLGTQFGLSLYDNGRLTDVVRMVVVKPEGAQEPEAPTKEQEEALAHSVGREGTEPSREGHLSDEEVAAQAEAAAGESAAADEAQQAAREGDRG